MAVQENQVRPLLVAVGSRDPWTAVVEFHDCRSKFHQPVGNADVCDPILTPPLLRARTAPAAPAAGQSWLESTEASDEGLNPGPTCCPLSTPSTRIARDKRELDSEATSLPPDVKERLKAPGEGVSLGPKSCPLSTPSTRVTWDEMALDSEVETPRLTPHSIHSASGPEVSGDFGAHDAGATPRALPPTAAAAERVLAAAAFQKPSPYL